MKTVRNSMPWVVWNRLPGTREYAALINGERVYAPYATGEYTKLADRVRAAQKARAKELRAQLLK